MAITQPGYPRNGPIVGNNSEPYMEKSILQNGRRSTETAQVQTLIKLPSPFPYCQKSVDPVISQTVTLSVETREITVLSSTTN